MRFLQRIFKATISNGVREIGQNMINNPLDWVQYRHEFCSKSNPDIKVWTANGITFIRISGNEGLSYLEKVYLNKCIKQSIANRLNNSPKPIKNER